MTPEKVPAPPTGPSSNALSELLDKAQHLQAPYVAKYVASVHKAHPTESPAQIIKRLEDRYLRTVTGSGGAVGATAAVPGVGTIAAVAAVGAESVFFMEASALLALATAEVHAIPIDNRELRKALVLTVAMGDAGLSVLRGVVGSKTATLKTLGVNPLQIPTLSGLNQRLMKAFVRRFAAKRAPLLLGKILPAGIGAVVGAGGNRVLGKATIRNARNAFGAPPSRWKETLIVDGVLEEPKTGN